MNIEKAAMKLAQCMDYPWEFMPEQGKQNMRKHAQNIIEAAEDECQDCLAVQEAEQNPDTVCDVCGWVQAGWHPIPSASGQGEE